MDKSQSRLVTGDSIDWAMHVRVTLRVEPKQGATLLAVAESVAALLSSTDFNALRTLIVDEPSNGRVILAIPHEFAKPELGVTQLLNLLSVPAEYDHCDALIFEHVELPKDDRHRYVGPRLGVDGVRQALGVPSGPIIGAIHKPRLLTNLDRAIETVEALGSAGLDFLVDDELMVDTTSAPFEERVRRSVDALNTHPHADGRRTRFIANVTSRPSQASLFAAAAKRLGAGGLVTNPVVTGFGALEDLAEANYGLPIFATNMGAALLAKGPECGKFAGFTEALISKFTRLAGADAIHGGINKADWYAVSPTQGAINVVSGQLDPISPAFRVVAGGLNLMTMIENWPLNDEPIIFEAGSSVFHHPSGPKAGAQALRKAWTIALEYMGSDEDSRETTKAALLREARDDNAVAQAIEVIGWQPSNEITLRMRSLPAKRTGWRKWFGKGK